MKYGKYPYIILNTSKKHVNYEEDKNKVPMDKPYNIQNTNTCNGIFQISFLFKNMLAMYLNIRCIASIFLTLHKRLWSDGRGI
jgi:hypothetical protein